ncbi:MAG: hypothetical protein O7A06_02950 [Acidobacteria bacterium]|nr:hypothetical protein [Acidobacteriota bacterium]
MPDLHSRMNGYKTARSLLLLLALVLIGAPQHGAAQAVRPDAAFEANVVPRNDDGSTSSAVPMGFTVNFFGVTFSETFVNNNGNITFGGSLGTFTPQGLVASPLRIIAPYWADVDTRGPIGNEVTYGQGILNGRPAFGVNYVNVGYFSSHDDKLNSFQVILIDRSDIEPGDFDIEFNYDRIEWETGDASGGSGGLGGTSASAGYSNGSGLADDSFEILGSRINGIFLDSNRNGLIHRRLNSDIRGRLVFFVRGGSVECTFSVLSIDEPFPFQGGTGVVQVAAPAGCEWSVSSNAGFVSIVGETTRSGSGNVEYNVSENRGGPRSAILTVAGQSVVVEQEGFVTIKVTPPSLNISSLDGSFPLRVPLQIEGIGDDPVHWAASVEVLDGDSNWRLGVDPSSGISEEDDPSTVNLVLNRGSVPLIPALALIIVRDVINDLTVEVPVLLAHSQFGPRLELSQSSFVFRTSQGGAEPGAQILRLLNTGVDSLAWSIPQSAVDSVPWLNFSSLSGIAFAGPTILPASFITVDRAGLAPGVYQALVPISAPGALNDPQQVSVTLQVVDADAASVPETSLLGLLFVGEQGKASPAGQNVTFRNAGGGDLTFELTATTESGEDWLGFAAASGNTVQVTANTAGLLTGVFQGTAKADFSDGTTQEIQVALLVIPPLTVSLFGSSSNCTPESLIAVHPTVGTGAELAVSYPHSLLTQVVNSCGHPVNDATVSVEVDGAAFGLLPVGGGLYIGTWTPQRRSSSLSMDFIILHSSLGEVQNSFDISVAGPPADMNLPAISTNGVVEAAGFARGWPLAPGGIISVFGSRLAPEEAFAASVPLPRQLGGVSLSIGGVDAPLFYVGPSQINAQVPFSVRPGNSVSVIVNSGGRLSAPQNYPIIPVRPGIIHSGGLAAALDGMSRPITFENPAVIGDTIQIFAMGLGLAEPPIGAGTASPSSSAVQNPVTVRIGGIAVPVLFEGYAPDFVGVYQVNVLLIPDVPLGNEVQVVIEQNRIMSNPNAPVTIPIRSTVQ